MKYVLGILILSMMIACVPTKNLAKQEINFQEGDDLIYEVRTKDDDGDSVEYEIELNINGVSEGYVSFDWEIFAERSGTIAMNENAITNATTLSFFEKEGYQSLENVTTIWLSQAVFKRLNANEKVEIGLDEQRVIFQKIGVETYSFGDKTDGKPYNVPVIIIANADQTIELWIANDAKNPIVVMVTMKDFSMDLINYKLFR